MHSTEKKIAQLADKNYRKHYKYMGGGGGGIIQQTKRKGHCIKDNIHAFQVYNYRRLYITFKGCGGTGVKLSALQGNGGKQGKKKICPDISGTRTHEEA